MVKYWIQPAVLSYITPNNVQLITLQISSTQLALAIYIWPGIDHFRYQIFHLTAHFKNACQKRLDFDHVDHATQLYSLLTDRTPPVYISCHLFIPGV